VPIQIKVFPDEVIIYNSGRLPENWSVADLLARHNSMPYNPNIANVFFRSGQIETWGRGIEKNETACQAEGRPEPMFRATSTEIRISFTAITDASVSENVIESVSDDPLTSTQRTIFSLISNNPSSTTSAISEKVGITQRRVASNIAKLKALGLIGRVVDEAYTRLLMERSDLPLADVLALDRVQKGLLIKLDVRRRLRDAGLIEGRSPHLQVSARIAEATDKQAEYMRTRAMDDAHYERLILGYLDKFGSATRRDLEALLLPKLSDVLNDKQKHAKLSNLLTKMRRDALVKRVGSTRDGRWERT